MVSLDKSIWGRKKIMLGDGIHLFVVFNQLGKYSSFFGVLVEDIRYAIHNFCEVVFHCSL